MPVARSRATMLAIWASLIGTLPVADCGHRTLRLSPYQGNDGVTGPLDVRGGEEPRGGVGVGAWIGGRCAA